MKQLIFLGNPGKEYVNTRHNVGFMIGDWLATKAATTWVKKNNYLLATLTSSATAWLIKPQTFMNLSSEIFRWLPAVKREEMLVIADDTALPLGRLRFRENGSCGGHNGLRSIENALGDNHYLRLRVGVGNAQFTVRGDKLADYVLANFNALEQELLKTTLARAAQACADWINHGIKFCQDQYNVNLNLRGEKSGNENEIV